MPRRRRSTRSDLAALSGCSVPLQRYPSAPSSSASPRRVLTWRIQYPGSGEGAESQSRRSVGVKVRRYARSRMSTDPSRYEGAPPPRYFVAPSPRPRGAGLPLERHHSSTPLLDIISPLFEVSTSDRVGAVAARRPQLLCPAAAGSRFVAAYPLTVKHRSLLFPRQLGPPPHCLLSEFLYPSNQADGV